MALVKKNEIKYDHYVDTKNNRHYINGVCSVLHCHHYTALYIQLAIDSGETELLKECSRESFRDMLLSYYKNNADINTIQSKLEIACQYYALVGLGKMKINFLGDEGGEVELITSHIDAGWLKKWGQFDKPINYICAGFIEAIFEIVLERKENSFEAIEKQSIVMGAETSIFTLKRR